MTTPLFRAVRLDGPMPGLAGLRAPAWTAVTVFLAASVALAAGFLAITPYARKQSTVGQVTLQAGTVRVAAPQAGTLDELFVVDGTVVQAGAALFAMDYRRFLKEGGTLEASVRQALQAQERLLREQMESEAARAASERDDLDSRIAGLNAERRGLLDQRVLLDRRVRVAAERFDGVAELRRRGLITETDFRAREDAWLARQQEMSAAEGRITAIGHSVRQATAQAARLGPDSADRIARIARLRAALAELDQHRAEKAAQGGEVVRAPVAGRVTALQAVPGQRADPAKPVLTLVPLDGAIRAELFVPSRAIGFVQPGQAVRLMYDAFPFQHFGAQPGTIDAVSETMLTPDEVAGPLRPAGPVYRVSVRLDRQSIAAQGREVPLQPDMTLRAEIVLDRRTVLHWLLDPLLGGAWGGVRP